MSVAPGERLMKMWPRCENIDTLIRTRSRLVVRLENCARVLVDLKSASTRAPGSLAADKE